MKYGRDVGTAASDTDSGEELSNNDLMKQISESQRQLAQVDDRFPTADAASAVNKQCRLL